MMRLKDKVAIVTGAGQGIGAAYARRLARRAPRCRLDINEAGRGSCRRNRRQGA
jgi:NAD(P)-dependent dehydrogenase (short-subunit alcohol dehydrogenase family)